jgi:hypothetical protein
MFGIAQFMLNYRGGEYQYPSFYTYEKDLGNFRLSDIGGVCVKQNRNLDIYMSGCKSTKDL